MDQRLNTQLSTLEASGLIRAVRLGESFLNLPEVKQVMYED